MTTRSRWRTYGQVKVMNSEWRVSPERFPAGPDRSVRQIRPRYQPGPASASGGPTWHHRRDARAFPVGQLVPRNPVVADGLSRAGAGFCDWCKAR
jgi:hypothetical protein